MYTMISFVEAIQLILKFLACQKHRFCEPCNWHKEPWFCYVFISRVLYAVMYIFIDFVCFIAIRYLWFFLEPLLGAKAENSSFLKKLAENIKQVKDAREPDNESANEVRLLGSWLLGFCVQIKLNYWFINHLIKGPIASQSIKHVINQAPNQSVDQSIDQAINQPVNQTIDQTPNQSIIQSPLYHFIFLLRFLLIQICKKSIWIHPGNHFFNFPPLCRVPCGSFRSVYSCELYEF